MKIYLAGGLFNAGERVHNLYLESALRKFGHEIILPQREALRFGGDGDKLDIKAVTEDCRKHCSDPDVICVCCIDGADADSGTAVEYGIAIATSGRAIVYRTDFRTDEKRQIGVNGMLLLKGTISVYCQCVITELSQLESYYSLLALRIHGAIKSLETSS